MNEIRRLSPRPSSASTGGLRGLWYPVLPSWAVQGTPVGITRLSENIVVWRDSDGRIHAVEDRCPHRGARLSLGWNPRRPRRSAGTTVWRCAEMGVVAAVPAVHACPLEGQKALPAYAAREIEGAIFLYFPIADEPPPPLELPEELTSDAYSRMLCTAHWKCNWRYAVDNVMDPMHGAYLHAQSHSMAEGDKKAEFRTRRTPTGFIFEKTGQMGVNFDWVEFGQSGRSGYACPSPTRRSSAQAGSSPSSVSSRR